MNEIYDIQLSNFKKIGKCKTIYYHPALHIIPQIDNCGVEMNYDYDRNMDQMIMINIFFFGCNISFFDGKYHINLLNGTNTIPLSHNLNKIKLLCSNYQNNGRIVINKITINKAIEKKKEMKIPELSKEMEKKKEIKIPQLLKEIEIFDTSNELKNAILLHIGNYDMWEIMASYLSKIKNHKVDLWVTLVSKETDKHKMQIVREKILDQYPSCHLLIIPNKGMDIGGFFYALKEIIDNKYIYQYILKLHTKTSNEWRNALILDLINRYDHIMRVFKKNPKICMIGSKHCIYKMSDNDTSNSYHLDRIFKRFSIKRGRSKFVAGTIFWTRFDIMKKIYADHLEWILDNLNDRTTYDINWMKLNNTTDIGNLLWDDASNMILVRDGMIEHAFERFFGYSLYNMNKELISI